MAYNEFSMDLAPISAGFRPALPLEPALNHCCSRTLELLLIYGKNERLWRLSNIAT